MQLETFGVFCDLAETHSLTATARRLHLTRKAARRQLALLEHEFKTELADCAARRSGSPGPAGSAAPIAADDRRPARLDAELLRAHELAANEFHLAVCFGIGFHQLPDGSASFWPHTRRHA